MKLLLFNRTQMVYVRYSYLVRLHSNLQRDLLDFLNSPKLFESQGHMIPDKLNFLVLILALYSRVGFIEHLLLFENY